MVFEVNFLFGLALIWIIFATIQDIRTREIANWLNFSLVIFALGFRFFYSLFEMPGLTFFYQGLVGFLVFYALSELFYYGKMFAGGDAKLMMALGAVLPWSLDLFTNVKIFFMFLTLFLVIGAVYGLIVSVVFGFLNFSRLKKELKIQLKKKKNFVFTLLALASVLLILSFFDSVFFSFGIFVFIIPYFYLYIKSVDEACMVKKIKPSKLTEGDWLYENTKVGKKIIKATWDGVSLEDIKLLRKKKFVLVRYGVQFAPVFLMSFVLLWAVWEFGIFGIGKFFGL